MATITEDYVSFKTAKLLKEKGFIEGAITKFFASGYDSKGNILNIRDTELKDYPRPTLQMAMKWLREVHNIHIVMYPYTDKEGQCWTFIFNKYAYDCWQELGIYITDYWNSYEEAAEVAIKYCLENLI